MTLYRYFRLDGAKGDALWPSDHALKPGAILRVDLHAPVALASNAWNEQTKDWVEANWTEVPNPASTTHACSICGDIHLPEFATSSVVATDGDDS